MTDKTAEQLRACPFCGATAEIDCTSVIEVTSRTYYMMWAYCTKCSAHSDSFQVDEGELPHAVMTAWNTRSDSGGAVADLKAIAYELEESALAARAPELRSMMDIAGKLRAAIASREGE